MSYRADSDAHADRADSLIREIAELERQRVARTAQDARLEEARAQLAALQPAVAAAPVERTPGLGLHLVVFAATAAVAFLGYTLVG
ncbi:MAG: hypothetical protein KBG48_06460 [Kofleriaceae bacterium]|jgi:hypothetical protein|nr:hypothetical protein [Kofleriaceae bacterium]MBP9167009.1 hypothetical protein [Kofleriaceae bacterium]MBP9858320.1 hypothetical protein [Kofleriaceae bacterium]